MSDSAQLIQIISDVLQANDANVRKQAEDLLTTLRNDKPNELIGAYLDILKGIPVYISDPTLSKQESSQLLNSDFVSLTFLPLHIRMSGIS